MSEFADDDPMRFSDDEATSEAHQQQRTAANGHDPDPDPDPDPPRQSPWRWNFTRPSDDARQPPLVYWDDHRGALGKGMLPKVIGGCSVIVWGKKSSHKSGLLIKECLDAALSKGAKVLYLACEGAHGIRTSRLPMACRQRGIDIEAIDDLWRTFPMSPGLMDNAELDGLIAACREEGFEPAIIVIDTLTRAVAGFDINAPATGAGLILGMERLGAAFDATMVAVTHPGKDSDRGAIGSSLIESLAFAIWRVALDGEAIFVEVQKMKDGPAEFSVPFKVVWAGPQGDAPAKQGVPVVVEVAPGEQLQRDSQPDGADKAPPKLTRAQLALNELWTCITEEHTRVLVTPNPREGIAPGVYGTTTEAWRERLLRTHVIDPKGRNPRARFQEIVQALRTAQTIRILGEMVWPYDDLYTRTPRPYRPGVRVRCTTQPL